MSTGNVSFEAQNVAKRAFIRCFSCVLFSLLKSPMFSNLLSNRFILRTFLYCVVSRTRSVLVNTLPHWSSCRIITWSGLVYKQFMPRTRLFEARTIEERINYHKIEILTNHLTACHSLTNHCSSLLCVICFVTRASFVSVHLFSILQCPINVK